MSGFSHFLAFACAARQASFAGAARELGVTPSTIAKRIIRLEQQLGVKLFHRTTRQVTLTSDGAVLFAHCEKILADIDALEAFAAGASGEPRGELRISAPITYGKRVVLPAVADLALQYPGLTADVRLSDQMCDLIKEGMDAAVRIMPLGDSRLAGRQIGVQHLVLCASSAYLAAHAEPRHPSDLAAHSFIVFRNPTSGRERPVEFSVKGKALALHPAYRIVLDDGEGMVEAARLGIGLAQVPDYMAADALASGALREVLPAFRPPPLPIHIVWVGNRLMPARVRAFIDAMLARAAQ